MVSTRTGLLGVSILSVAVCQIVSADVSRRHLCMLMGWCSVPAKKPGDLWDVCCYTAEQHISMNLLFIYESKVRIFVLQILLLLLACLFFSVFCESKFVSAEHLLYIYIYRGFLARMVYLRYISCLRYTSLVRNPWYIEEWNICWS